MNEKDAALEGAALVSLARDNIPTDIQTLLIQGDPMRSIPPHCLMRAMVAMMKMFADIVDPTPRR